MYRKNILITGASSGLGAGLAREYAARGCNLALCARRREPMDSLREALLKDYPDIKIDVRELDVCDYERVFEVFRAFNEVLGGIDRVIVNAGMGKGGALGTGLFHANRRTAETNFIAALAQCEAALEIFRAQNAGHLVTISSIAAMRGMGSSFAIYSSSKAGLATLSDAIRVDVRGTPIKVSCIFPGFIHTEINDGLPNTPFRIDAESGCRHLRRAIDSERRHSYVPFWPWWFVARLLKILPDAVIARFGGRR